MYDLAVIGIGPGGLEAINLALKHNLKVVAFEKALVGGCCLNVGCIPTKTLLHSAKTLSNVKRFSDIGLELNGNVDFNWQKMLIRKENIVSKFRKPLEMTLSKNIDLIKSEAKIVVNRKKTLIEADNKFFEAKNIIISTGSTSKELPDLKFDHDKILSSDDLYNLKSLPKSVAIVGSGAIGLEWGYIFSSLNVETTIIEKMPNLAPNMDIDVSKRLDRILKLNKIKYFKNDFIVSYSDNVVTLNSLNKVQAEKILVAVGRKPVLPDVEGGEKIIINNGYETNYDNIFVAGDLKGYDMLAHSASFDARRIVNKILFNKNYSSKLIPSVIYITPEIASVGVKEQDINIEEYTVKKLPVASLAKAWADDSSEGFIKLITKDNLLYGASVVSNEASSLISILNLIIEYKIPLDEVEDFIFPHPTYSEIISEVIKRG